ncbi:MAG: hypothetical protein ACT4RN_20475 [Pseudonocardia sp.]
MLAATGGAAGCAADPGPVFDNEGGREVGCMIHQAEEPGARYTDPAQRDTTTNFALLRYYTANGAKPYCDGAPAGDTDRAWAQVYVDLGGTAAKVPSVLG